VYLVYCSWCCDMHVVAASTAVPGTWYSLLVQYTLWYWSTGSHRLHKPIMNTINTGESESSALLLKILTIGDTAVGKTCLIMRFSGEEFTQSFITTVGIGALLFFSFFSFPLPTKSFPPYLYSNSALSS
jgi:hypothetical protein